MEPEIFTRFLNRKLTLQTYPDFGGYMLVFSFRVISPL